MYHLGSTSRLHSTVLDNNFCGLDQYFNNTLPRNWNFDKWSVPVPSPPLTHCVIASSQHHKPRYYRDNWAKTSAKNKDLKVFIGAPASQDAGAHYVTADQMGQIVAGTRSNYASFGGVMLWDAYAAICECVHVNLMVVLVRQSRARSPPFYCILRLAVHRRQ